MIRKLVRRLFIRERAEKRLRRIMLASPFALTGDTLRTVYRLERIAAGRKPFVIGPDEWREALEVSGNL
jgi:hypothetical protein